MYESISKAMERRKYRRLEPSGASPGFVVQPKRVTVAHLAAGGKVRRRGGHRLRLRCFRLRFLQPSRLVAAVKAAAAKLMQVTGGSRRGGAPAGSMIAPPQALIKPVLLLPSNRPLRSSGNDVIDEVWFQTALRRSIAEGRLPI